MDDRTINGKRLSLLFFSENKRDGDGKYICDACNAHAAQSGGGYSNLCGHINRHHSQEIKKRQQEHKQEGNKLFKALTFPSKTCSIHAWIECVVLGLQPFSFVEHPTFRKHFKQDSISRNTLMKYMGLVVTVVEEKISRLLLDRFVIIFDGWACGNTHFVCLLATYPSNSTCGYEKLLLAMFPMDNEASNNAQEHYDFPDFVLSVYKKNISHVVDSVGDNASTNRSFGRQVGPCFVGCHSHRYNLAVKDILLQHEDLLSKVKGVMKRLSYQIPAAKLRQRTHLRVKEANETLWSSSYHMLRRYLDIEQFLSSLDVDGLSEMILTSDEHYEAKELFNNLKALDSLTVKLQDRSTTLADARSLFYAVISKYPYLKDRLNSKARIVENPSFEMGIVKVQNKKESSLSVADKTSLLELKLRDTPSSVEQPKPNTQIHNKFAEKILKRRRLECNPQVNSDTLT